MIISESLNITHYIKKKLEDYVNNFIVYKSIPFDTE